MFVYLSYSFQAEEDKANRLNKLKNKLEGQVQETQDELEKEKREKAEGEKVRRKLEGDLKTTQEQVENVTHTKQELEKTLTRYVRVCVNKNQHRVCYATSHSLFAMFKV